MFEHAGNADAAQLLALLRLALAPGEASPKEATLSQAAIVAALPIAERRVEQAGLRIADLLDAAFAPGALPAPAR